MAFAAERERLLSAMPGVFIELQRIGSTAVPGLQAKPIIDILAGVESMGVAVALVDRVCRSGYTTSAEFNATLTDRRWFMRSANGHRTHHLHVVVHSGIFWQEHLEFRDKLLSDPDLADRYVALKVELAERFRTDRDAYTDAKGQFIRSALGKS
jgi:GrpB-like predicted nucleotidyltransferase (UPF0157 family)